MYCSIILDYETEKFLKKINNLILSVNNYKGDIKYKILLDEKINAFVNHNNEIYISSGLIKNSSSYTALLGVLAHEIGHIEKYHISKKKKSIENLSSTNTVSTLSLLAGSIITKNPAIFQGLLVSQAGISNYYIGFSKDQEREADHYAIDTLNKLKLAPDSLIKLLNSLQAEHLKHGSDEIYKKFSTHPVYKERYDIINERKNIKSNPIDNELEKEFNFIKAKFFGYSSDIEQDFTNQLTDKYANYSNSILHAKNGDLKNSLKLLNKLIYKNKENYFLLETKADILMSYGYNKEAIKFYNKVIKRYPNNKYVKLRIFNNTSFNQISQKEKYFKNNINLLFDFPKHKILYLKFEKLSENLNKKNWLSFFIIHNQKDKIEINEYNEEIKNIIKITNDADLSRLLNFHIGS